MANIVGLQTIFENMKNRSLKSNNYKNKGDILFPLQLYLLHATRELKYSQEIHAYLHLSNNYHLTINCKEQLSQLYLPK